MKNFWDNMAGIGIRADMRPQEIRSIKIINKACTIAIMLLLPPILMIFAGHRHPSSIFPPALSIFILSLVVILNKLNKSYYARNLFAIYGLLITFTANILLPLESMSLLYFILSFLSFSVKK